MKTDSRLQHDVMAHQKSESESAAKRVMGVNVSGHKATLSGTVGSWYQTEEAGRIAWSAPGVWLVDNNIAVDYIYG